MLSVMEGNRSIGDRRRLDVLENFVTQSMASRSDWEMVFAGYGGAHLRDLSDYQFQMCYPSTSFFKNTRITKKLYNDGFSYAENLCPPDSQLSCYNLWELCYPQVELDLKINMCSTRNAYFLSPKFFRKIEECKRLYKEIVAMEDDEEKWFAALEESGDHKFICDNVEYRLGTFLSNTLDVNRNKPLWKLYIDYLKKTGHVELLLQTYSKYCRTFAAYDDVLVDYHSLAQKNTPHYVPWRNPFSFERYDPYFFASKARRGRGIAPRFTPSNAIAQFFTLPTPMIKYVRENASPQVLQKLYESCKIFFIRTPRTNCYNFTFVAVQQDDIEEQHIVGNSIFLYADVRGFSFDKLEAENFNFDGSVGELRAVFQKFQRFHPKSIMLQMDLPHLHDIDFLFHHDGINEITIESTLFTPLSVESLLALLPSIKKIKLTKLQCTSETAKKLLQMDFKDKIELIELVDLNTEALDPYVFAKFVVAKCARGAQISLGFTEGVEVNGPYLRYFSRVMKSAKKRGLRKLKIRWSITYF